MSDGGISIMSVWGPASCELKRPILVREGWLEALRSKRAEILFDVTNEQAKSVLREKGYMHPKPRGAGFHWTLADAAWEWNAHVDWVTKHHLGFSDDAPRTARDRRKAGMTERLSPERWLSVRGELNKIHIPRAAWTNAIWREQTEHLMALLLRGDLPDGFLLDRSRPRLRPRAAANLVWFLSQMGFIGTDEIDVCDKCYRVIDTASETHDWCSRCGKMRCQSCTTAPDHCQCDYPCRKHCKCKEEDE